MDIFTLAQNVREELGYVNIAHPNQSESVLTHGMCFMVRIRTHRLAGIIDRPGFDAT